MTPLLLAVLLLVPQAEPAPSDAADPAAVAAPAPEEPPLYTPPAVRPFEMPAGVSYDAYEAEPAPPAPEAVKLEAYRRSYEGSKTVTEQVYERGVRGAFESAQVRMGRLDGQWTVAGSDGAPLMVLLLNDPGSGEIDGAWRDLRAGPGVAATELLESVARQGADLVIRFTPRGQSRPAELRLSPVGDSRWVGALQNAAGHQRVTAARS